MLYRGTKTLIAGLLAVSIGGLTYLTFATPSNNTPSQNIYNSVTIPANSDGILSQCGDTFIFAPEKERFGTIPKGYKGDIPHHPMTIPVYGYMSNQAFDYSKYKDLKFGDKNPYTHPEILRAQWQGYHVIWTSVDFTEDGYKYVKDYADKWNDTHSDKVLVLQWNLNDTGDNILPLNREIAFASWNSSQSCGTFANKTFEQYITATQNNVSPRDNENPPTAPLTADGELHSMQRR
jgi:hypothetical protein